MESLLYLLIVSVAVKGGVRYLRSAANVEEIRDGQGIAREWETRKEILARDENAAAEAFRARVNRGAATLGAPSPFGGVVVAWRALEAIVAKVKEWQGEAEKLNGSAQFTNVEVTAAALPLSPEAFNALDALSPETLAGLRPATVGRTSYVALGKVTRRLKDAWRKADVDGMREATADLKGYTSMVDRDTAARIEEIRNDATRAAREISKAVKDRGESAATIARFMPESATSSVDALQFALIANVDAFDASDLAAGSAAAGCDLAVQIANVDANNAPADSNDNAADAIPDLVVDPIPGDGTGTDGNA